MATAKDFKPGDLRVCNDKRCIAIANRSALRAFSSFFYGDRRTTAAQAPRSGTPWLELRDSGGHAMGIVGGRGLDRMLVYGLNCGRFRRGIWYRLPARPTLEVRTLGARLGPLATNSRPVPRSC